MNRRSSVICLPLVLAVLLFAVFTNAATYFPDQASGPDQQLQAYLDGLAPGTETVHIDDMAFRTEDLQRSGYSGTRWTNGQIYYDFAADINQTQRNQWLAAAQVWSNVADVTFIPRTNQANYIHVISAGANWSYVGMVGGRQDMSIDSWSFRYIIAHEIAHALGAGHEHQRPDRNGFVSVYPENVQYGYEDNFNIVSMVTYSDYDYDSVMHYPGCAFSIDCDPGTSCDCNNLTIEVLPPNQDLQDQIGQYDHLSASDIQGMAMRYGYPPDDVPQYCAEHEYWELYVNDSFVVNGYTFYVVGFQMSGRDRIIIRDPDGDTATIYVGNIREYPDFDCAIQCITINDIGTLWGAVYGLAACSSGPTLAGTTLEACAGQSPILVAQAIPGEELDYHDASYDLVGLGSDTHLEWDLDVDTHNGGEWIELEVEIPNDAGNIDRQVMLQTEYESGAVHFTRIQIDVTAANPISPIAAPVLVPNPAHLGDLVIVNWYDDANVDTYQLQRNGVGFGPVVLGPPVQFVATLESGGVFTVSAANECGYQVSAPTNFVVECVVPQAPGPPVFADNPACSLAPNQLTWPTVIGADYYVVYFSNAPLSAHLSEPRYDLASTGGAYAVRAGNTCGESPLSDAVVLEITPVPTAPGAPLVTPNPYPPDTVVVDVSWEAVEYAIQYAVYVNGLSQILVATPSAQIPAQPGNFAVKAIGECGESPLGDSTLVEEDVSGLTYQICGIVTDARNWRLTDMSFQGFPAAVEMDEAGNYCSVVPHGWSGTVTPVREHVAFTPGSRQYLNVTHDYSDQDFQGVVPGIISIDDIQMYDAEGIPTTSYANLLVSIEATVFVVPGTYSVGGGYTRDISGGVNYYWFSNPPALLVGDRVRMRGYVWWSSLQEIYLGAPDIVPLGFESDVAPVEMTIAELQGNYEAIGSFVSTGGEVIEKGTLPNGNAYVSLADGPTSLVVYIDSDTEANLDAVTIGDWIRVKSPVMNFNGEIRLSPRYHADLEIMLTPVEEHDLTYEFALHPCYPNPFNPMTTIAFDVPTDSQVSLRIYDVSGHLVRNLCDGTKLPAGRHERVWNGRNDSEREVPSGVYFYRLEAAGLSATNRMSLLK